MEDLQPIADPRAAFYRAAVATGVIREGDPLDQKMVDYAIAVVDLCASVGDKYSNNEGNAGEEIRAVYGEP